MLLDREQLSEALSVAESTIGSWEEKGMPTARKGRGRGKKSLYDFDKVVAWCRETGHGTSLQTILKRLARSDVADAESSAADARRVARAIAIARARCLEDSPSYDFVAAPLELVEFLGVYIVLLSSELERAGIVGVDHLLEERESSDAWPETLDAIVERARAEIPAERLPQ